MIDGAYPSFILKNSIINTWKFPWRIVISLVFSNKFSKLLALPPLTI